MAQNIRQSSLFAAEDFSVVYESFAQADFQSYDFDTIRNSMVNYINNNYPENFNDWISSSEFVSLIELMAFLGHNLAFRADLASRENFLSTAERRESVLRIAEFLGYKPTRNVVASGYLKIDSVRTNQLVYDVNGNSLANVTVQYEDTTDPDTYQNFLSIMNSIFQSSNRFGSPFAKFTKNNVQYEIYRTNSSNNDVIKEFSGIIDSGRTSFTAHSISYDQARNKLEEKIPDPYGVYDLLYQNDNGGLASPNTGFFFGFKEGSLQYKDFSITTGLPNMVIDINENNVANGNIWVQTIDEVGQVLATWTQIDRLFGNSNIVNNSSSRNVYTVSSRENDQVSIVFADGNFGNIPRGIIRVWYRTGINRTYNINPDTFNNVTLSINYTGQDSRAYVATFNCSLKSPVSNASERETIDSIKVNSGRFFATQDRMVTADDYTVFPLTVSENILKIKSINRVHSGHSRFRDLYDPTATYSDAIQYTDDAYIYKEDVTTRSSILLPSVLNSEQILSQYINPILSNPEVKNFYYDRQYYGYETGGYNSNNYYNNTTESLTYLTASDSNITGVYRWNQVTRSNNSCTGYITYNSFVQRLGDSASAPLRKLEVNGLVEFITSPFRTGYIKTIEVISGGSGYSTAPTVTITGIGSSATATANISAGVVVSVTITNAGTDYDSVTNVTFTGGGGSGATAKVTVSNADTVWARIVKLDNGGFGVDDSVGNPTGVNVIGQGAVTLSSSIPSGARIKRIIPSWESQFTNTVKTAVISKIANRLSFGLRYNPSIQEWVVIDSSNLPASNIANNSVSSWSRQYEGDTSNTGRDNSWLIRINYANSQWEVLTRKTRYIIGSDATLKFNNLNFAESFSSETLKPGRDKFEFLPINTKSTINMTPLGKKYTFNSFGYFTYPEGYTDPYKLRVTLDDNDNDTFINDPESFKKLTSTETINLGTKLEYYPNEYEFIVHDDNGSTTVNGRAYLHMKYTRIADINQVIDPAVTNIIDTYVLLRSYDTSFRTWALRDGRSYTKPNPPTISDLTETFTSLETKKSISDQIIYRPVKYKILFGDLANPELQAKFNVTKTSNATMSDVEIKQQIITLINEFFSIENWDFGETFYFTELAAYVHNNMIGQISQITISSVSNPEDLNSLYEIHADSDELFVPVLSIGNFVITNTVITNATSIAANTGVSTR